MTSEDAIRKLSKLSERERQVLQLKCDGLDQKAIGKELSISVPTVKYDMSRIYVRLELDQLSATERLKALLEIYCPALAQEALPPGPPEAEEPQPIPRAIVAMIEEDERALVPQRPNDVIVIPPQPIQPRRRPPRPAGWLVGGRLSAVLLSMLLIVIIVIFFAFRGFRGGEQTQVTTVPATPSAPILPTATTVVQQVIVVVTATPPPASPTAAATDTPPQPPTATPSLDTPPGTRLKVGDTWQQERVSLTLKKTSFDNFQGNGELWLSFDFANNSGSDLSVAFDIRNVVVEANNSIRFRTFYSEEQGATWKQTIANGDRQDVWFYQSTQYSWLGDYFSPSVSYILVTVRNWSRIAEAVWQIDIQH